MSSLLTSPRQVRLIKCAILAPGLELRGQNADDISQLKNYGFDIAQYVQQIDIYESVFDNTISASIVVLENVGLTEYLPLTGVETFALVFEIDAADGTTPRQFSRAFRIVAIKDQAYPRHDFRLYTIHLVTNEFVKSVSGRVCRGFHNMSCEDAVKDIMSHDLVTTVPLITDEPSYSTVDIVIPNYTPLAAINYFTTLAQTTKTPRESNFLFFETLDGFHFTSIRKLITDGLNNPDLLVFNVDPAQMSTTPTVSESIALNNIMRMHQEQSFDLLFDIASGMLRSRMITFDFLARKVSGDTDGDSRYTDSFKATTHLDRFPLYPNNFDLSVDNNVRVFTVPTNHFSAGSRYIAALEPQPEQRMHEAVVLRNRQLREIRHIQTLLDLPGQPDLRAGSVVIVNYPSTRFLQDATDQSVTAPTLSSPTPYYSGPHLVTSVHHILMTKAPGSMEYHMNIKVNKDSLGSPLFGTDNITGS